MSEGLRSPGYLSWLPDVNLLSDLGLAIKEFWRHIPETEVWVIPHGSIKRLVYLVYLPTYITG